MATPVTYIPIAPPGVSVCVVVAAVGERGKRMIVFWLVGLLGKIMVLAALRYHGPMM